MNEKLPGEVGVFVQGRIEQLLVSGRYDDQSKGDHSANQNTACGPMEMSPDQPRSRATQEADCR
jgi:hypothetical protein